MKYYTDLLRIKNRPFENLQASLAQSNPYGTKHLEIYAAIRVYPAKEQNKQMLVNVLKECYARNEGLPDLRAQCIKALIKADLKQGVALADEFMNNEKNDLVMRMVVAHSALLAGDLQGYQLLGPGLVHPDAGVRRQAGDLFRTFEPLNGLLIPNETTKVDLDDLLAHAQERAAGDRERLELAELSKWLVDLRTAKGSATQSAPGADQHHQAGDHPKTHNLPP
jgi:hypothetical protein